MVRLTHRRRTLLRAFGSAVRGLAWGLRTERNLRIHTAAAIAALGLGLLLRLDGPSLAVLVLTAASVLTAELTNTAVERTLDHLHPRTHPAVGRIKDLLAGMVLLHALSAAAVGLLVLLPPLLATLRNLRLF